MCGVRLLTIRLKDLLLDSASIGEAQQVNCFLEVPTGDDHAGGTHSMKLERGGAHLIEICDRQLCQGSRLLDVRRNYRGQR